MTEETNVGVRGEEEEDERKERRVSSTAELHCCERLEAEMRARLSLRAAAAMEGVAWLIDLRRRIIENHVFYMHTIA